MCTVVAAAVTFLLPTGRTIASGKAVDSPAESVHAALADRYARIIEMAPWSYSGYADTEGEGTRRYYEYLRSELAAASLLSQARWTGHDLLKGHERFRLSSPVEAVVRTWSDAATTLTWQSILIDGDHSAQLLIERGDFNPRQIDRRVPANSPMAFMEGYLSSSQLSVFHGFHSQTGSTVELAEVASNGDLRAVYVLPEGRVEIRLSREQQYAPVEFTLITGPTDLYNGQPLWLALGGQHAQRREEFRQTINVVLGDFVDVHGMPIPRAGRLTTTTYRPGVAPRTTVIRASRTVSTQVPADFDFEDRSMIEVGTPCLIIEKKEGTANPIEYVWNGHGLVTIVSSEALSAHMLPRLSIPDGEVTGSPTIRIYLAAAVLLLFALILIIALTLRRKEVA
ncbi:MAG TPA: hypothetical protein PJ982_13010 [Lacipirellulaceae bacterium]|nr:hypothetical protein [Lacipirellulaceae bacterium]